MKNNLLAKTYFTRNDLTLPLTILCPQYTEMKRQRHAPGHRGTLNGDPDQLLQIHRNVRMQETIREICSHLK